MKSIRHSSAPLRRGIRFALGMVCLALLSMVGLLLLWGIGLVAYFHLARPKPPVVDDGDLRLVEPAVSDDENAYVAFMAVTNLLDCSCEDREALHAYTRHCDGQPESFGSWRRDGTPEACRAEVDRILAERAEGLKGLHRAVLRPKYRIVPDADGSCFPPISAMSLAHGFLQVQADRARERGDFEQAFAAERDGFRLETLCRNNASTLVEGIVGGGFGAQSCRRLASLANEDGVSDGLLTAVAELLRDDFDAKALFERTVRREYSSVTCRSLDRMGDTVSVDELSLLLQGRLNALIPTDSRMSCPHAPVIARMPGFARFAYDRERTRQDLASVFRAGLAGRDIKEMLPQPRSILQPNFVGRLVARGVAPAFKGFSCHLKESLFALRAARTAVALRRYGRANAGAVPSDLSALVPTYIGEVPRDPFAPDRALEYDAATRQIWTVGPDGDFNALDSGRTAKADSRRKRAKCAFRLDGKRFER